MGGCFSDEEASFLSKGGTPCGVLMGGLEKLLDGGKVPPMPLPLWETLHVYNVTRICM